MAVNLQLYLQILLSKFLAKSLNLSQPKIVQCFSKKIIIQKHFTQTRSDKFDKLFVPPAGMPGSRKKITMTHKPNGSQIFLSKHNAWNQVPLILIISSVFSINYQKFSQILENIKVDVLVNEIKYILVIQLKQQSIYT